MVPDVPKFTEEYAEAELALNVEGCEATFHIESPPGGVQPTPGLGALLGAEKFSICYVY